VICPPPAPHPFALQRGEARGSDARFSLVGDATNARRLLGWEAKVSFRELARKMVNADIALAERERRVG